MLRTALRSLLAAIFVCAALPLARPDVNAPAVALFAVLAVVLTFTVDAIKRQAH